MGRTKGEAHAEGAMTFAAIGAAMGMTTSGAYSLFNRALAKLRRRTPNAVEVMRQQGEALAEARAERQRKHITGGYSGNAHQRRIARRKAERLAAV